MIWKVILLIGLIQYACTTPPACFLSCISEVTRSLCDYGLPDLTCACKNENSLTGCLVDICPYGTFLSARDHFIGTCLEHGRPSITNPFPPPSIWPANNAQEVFREVNEEYDDITQGISQNPPPTSSSMSSQINQPHKSSARVQSTPHYPPPKYLSHSDVVDDNNDDSDYDPNAYFQWEDTDSLDEYGNFIIIRRPVNVPKQFRDPRNVGNSRRVFIRYSSDHSNRRVNIVNPHTLKAKETPKQPNKLIKYTIDTPEGQYRVSKIRSGMY
ncbi:uncharacterized protein SPAPADRAFT_61171 [Spathaspora passalidarum NRRL Y-27907]|uniref:Extracellular membrane protein CFEM domain-containing protein n=1 Tax=Spathaspora passalidarum (strain NRRL Y-27907 / 11-Y1) TaxID=619300 RepID=G3APB5_SPAPN|nr:uncharacterized protein SPAPADRAFT_61171 [Spathaspora passalidarum NRRL Y-27907]EGW32091.1 hypothetical protein SPAPADRAFT_61171 [Spathaspora passalidarum NRRL Y-27907]